MMVRKFMMAVDLHLDFFSASSTVTWNLRTFE